MSLPASLALVLVGAVVLLAGGSSARARADMSDVAAISSGRSARTSPALSGSPDDQTAPILQVFSDLPGTHAGAVMLPDGQHVGADAGREQRSASVIKLWIAGAALQAATTGGLNLDEQHVVTEQEQATGTGILNEPGAVGRSLSYRDLIDTMLVYSDNTAANIVTRRIGGYDAVNAYAQTNGYTQTLMQRDLGSIDLAHDNYTSAGDMELFIERVLNGAVVDEASSALVRASLQTRRAEEAPVYDYFGRLLPPGTDYRHLSGLDPTVRNDVGYYATAQGWMIVAIMLQDLPNDSADENALSRAVRQIYDLYPQ